MTIADKHVNKQTKFLASICVAALMTTGCASTTKTGSVGIDRKQLLLVSQQQVSQMSGQAYQELLTQTRAKNALDKDPVLLARLQRIANRLIPHVSTYRQDAANWNWELHTIASKQVNAFVLPGGKIMFYSGIVSELKLNDSEIAAIMGHEMSHVLREHTRERMSSSQLTQLGLGIATSKFQLSHGQTKLAGVASKLGVHLPHSRVQETEADIMGLELMARAGYNPQAAIALWQKMQQHKNGSSPPQFMSTHPSSSNRIVKLQSYMPRVTPLYRQALSKNTFNTSSKEPLSTQPTSKVKFKTYKP